MRFSASAIVSLLLLAACNPVHPFDDDKNKLLRGDAKDDNMRALRIVTPEELEERKIMSNILTDCDVDEGGLQFCISLPDGSAYPGPKKSFFAGGLAFSLGFCEKGTHDCYLFLQGDEGDDLLGIKVTSQCTGNFVGLNTNMALQLMDDAALNLGCSLSANGELSPETSITLFCANSFAMYWSEAPHSFYKHEHLCQAGGPQGGKFKVSYRVQKFKGEGKISPEACDEFFGDLMK